MSRISEAEIADIVETILLERQTPPGPSALEGIRLPPFPSRTVRPKSPQAATAIQLGRVERRGFVKAARAA
jgi:hypothetical protein